MSGVLLPSLRLISLKELFHLAFVKCVCFVCYSAHKKSSEVLHVEHGSFDAETWTLRKVELGSFKVWMDNVSWTDRVRNEVQSYL